MPSENQNNDLPKSDSPESTESAVKPLSKGYLWRLCVILALTLGGIVCMIFFNSLIGVLILAAALFFGKNCGIDKMNSSYLNDTGQ